MIAAALVPKLTCVLHHQASQDLLVAAKKIIGETIDNVSADLRKISIDVSVYNDIPSPSISLTTWLLL